MVFDSNLMHAALVPLGLVLVDAVVRAVGAAKHAPERTRGTAALNAAADAITNDLGPIGGALLTGILAQGSLSGIGADLVSGGVGLVGAAVTGKAVTDIRAHLSDLTN